MKNFANPLLSILFGSQKEGDEPSSPLGEVWQGPDALKAYQGGHLVSKDAGKCIRICFRHLIEDEPEEINEKRPRRAKKSIWYSWVDEHRTLHPFRKIKPVIQSTVDGKTVVDSDHIEKSYLGHAFVFVVRETDDEDDEPEFDVKSIDEVTVVGGYRPHALSADEGVDEDDYPCHILEITEEESTPGFLRACRPAREAFSKDFPLAVREADCLEPLDTKSKEYVKEHICWWPVRLEKDAFGEDRQLREIFKKDLDHALKCLPHNAYHALKDTKTEFWVNKTFKYGPKIRPQTVDNCCFHPDQDWLVKQGFHPEKAGCIEIYDIANYQKDRDLWGCGGVLIHELAHAYHKKCVPDGFENAEIIACYEKAMEEGLYNMVKVHGPQGPKARAYACNNPNEYFAELSTAFLGGKNINEEFNKWFPYNRAQIKEHDPRAYELLCKVWKIRP